MNVAWWRTAEVWFALATLVIGIRLLGTTTSHLVEVLEGIGHGQWWCAIIALTGLAGVVTMVWDVPKLRLLVSMWAAFGWSVLLVLQMRAGMSSAITWLSPIFIAVAILGIYTSLIKLGQRESSACSIGRIAQPEWRGGR